MKAVITYKEKDYVETVKLEGNRIYCRHKKTEQIEVFNDGRLELIISHDVFIAIKFYHDK